MYTKAVLTINKNAEGPKDKNNNSHILGKNRKISSIIKNNTTMIAVTKVWFVCRFCQRAYEFKEGLLKHKRQLHRELLPSYKRKKEAAQENPISSADSQKSGGKTTDNGVQNKKESEEGKQNKRKMRKKSDEKNDNDASENDTNEASSPQPITLKRRFSERNKEVKEKPVSEPPPYKLRKKTGQDDKDNVDTPKKKAQQKPESKEAEPDEQEENETTRSDDENEDEEQEEKEKERQTEERDIKFFPKKVRPSELEVLLSEASYLLSPSGRRSTNREPRKASLNKDYKDPVNTLKNKFIKRKGGVRKVAVGTKTASPKKR